VTAAEEFAALLPPDARDKVRADACNQYGVADFWDLDPDTRSATSTAPVNDWCRGEHAS
jgi:hypothetical protein